jgi:ribosomal protein S3
VLPLNSINKNIEYGSTSATNAYGSCGIKVWIHYEV